MSGTNTSRHVRAIEGSPAAILPCTVAPRQRAAGFTLVELMVVVVLIAILAAIAYPSYQNSVIRGNRSSVQQYMMDIASRQEQYILDAHAYTSTVGVGGLNLAAPQRVADHYTVTVAVTATPPGYTITATPLASSIQASDGVLTYDNVGAKTPAAKWGT